VTSGDVLGLLCKFERSLDVCVHFVNNEYSIAMKNEVRDFESAWDVRESLEVLGNLLSQEILQNGFISEREFMTPMGCEVKGPRLTIPGCVVVVTTSVDKDSLGKGISVNFKEVKQGEMNFSGLRGMQALNGSPRDIVLPANNNPDLLVIGKTVLATGCTAISLTRTAVEELRPKKTIIASVFYSNKGLEELCNGLAGVDFEVFVIGEPDELNEDGMLIPGVGDLDRRIQEST